MDNTGEKHSDSSKLSDRHVAQPLRYRTRAFWLLGFYVLLIVVPWVLTCVLAQRPINAGSYVRQRGFTDDEVATMHKWKIAVDVLNSIAGLITIPILSAVLAQAAVLFCQRRKPDEFLSLRDMFAIADRGWTNPSLIWSSLQTQPVMRGRKSSARFLLPAAFLITLGALQQPLYQILVRSSTASVLTCRTIPSWYIRRNCTGSALYEEVGRELEPGPMALAEHLPMLSQVISGLASLSSKESQTHLWSVDPAFKPGDHLPEDHYVPDDLFHWLFQRSYYLGDLGEDPTDYPLPDFFVASVPMGTTTGVLRQHLMRLNSSATCEKVDSSDFPSPCPGDQPLTVSWQGVLIQNVRVCVPGNYTAYPWVLNRSRQDLIEEIYINVNITGISDPPWSMEDGRSNLSYSIHCTGKTTRGYFELGSDLNNNTNGPLLDDWPDKEEMRETFNDWTGWGQGDNVGATPYIPSDIDSPFTDNLSPPLYINKAEPSTWKVPGPLMMSALALFGGGSWLSRAANYTSKVSSSMPDEFGDYKGASWHSFCREMPFSKLDMVVGGGLPYLLNKSDDMASACDLAAQATVNGDEAREEHVLLAAHYLLADLGPYHTHYKPGEWLKAAMFVANHAFLTSLSPELRHKEFSEGGRVIYSSPGIAVQKPGLSKKATIVLSALISLQLLGLGYLTYYLYRVPTWSGQLDAMAMARIGASLHSKGVLPAIGPVSKEDLDALQTVSGLIGIVERSPRGKSFMARSVSPDLTTTDGSDAELQRLHLAEEGCESFGDSTRREISMVGSESPDLASIGDSELESQRLDPTEEDHESSKHGSPGAMSPTLATTDSSDAESQRLNPTEELRGSFEGFSTGMELGLDAPGPILTTDVPRRGPYVRGMRRVWRAFQSTKRP